MSNTILKMEKFEMLRSMYDFKATYSKTLSFKANDYFLLHQTATKHKNWWEVINEHGEMGYIPSNYVKREDVAPCFYNQWLETVIECVIRNEIQAQYMPFSKKDLLTRLQDMKRKYDYSTNENDSGPDLLYTNSDGEIKPIRRRKSSLESNDSHKKPSKENSFDNSSQEEQRKSVESIALPEATINKQNVYELVESVRINTQLSHEMSRIAVATVVQGLHELLPASVFPHLSTILTHTENNLSVDDVQIEQTHDASRLKIIFHELTYCKEDSQQRSWMLHEDEDTIKDYLIELRSILSNADPSITRHVISQDDYLVVITLIQYYQMEIRWSIRQLLLQVFGCMCGLEKTILVIMLNSILPGELARDMLASQDNAIKLNYSALLLTMMFSMGEPMPITHLEFLGNTFIQFILNNIECPPDDEDGEDIPDLFVNFILSFNLQFTKENPEDNVIIEALSEQRVAKHFTEKILLLFNRDEDPVRIFDHEPVPPHSVVKLFNDLFNNHSTAQLFYTNDVKVLIDITVRNILDLSAGDTRRHPYIELCRRIVRNTNYHEHLHQRDEILKCFTRIFCEENTQSLDDQQLVREIINEFPNYFK